MSEQTKNADVAQQDSPKGMLKRLTNPKHFFALIKRFWNTLCIEGAEQLWRDIVFRVALAFHRDLWQHRADIPTRRQLKNQRNAPINAGKISVIVPLYNTPMLFLKQLMASVLKQTYQNWELCLVNASSSGHGEVERYCLSIAKKDARVKYKKLVENKGIAENTNAGFAMATGDFLTLLDHDDLLYQNALYEVAKEILEHKAEMVYSDEIVLSANLKELGGYHFKPDYAPDFLNSCNYITHLCVFSRELFEKAGGKQNAIYDGAQDYDLILRLTENLTSPKHIRHIPKVLYIWRAAAGSTAENLVEAKPYAIKAGELAISDHLARIGRLATVTAIKEAPGAYRVHYALTSTPKISVIIPNKDHTDDLERCLSSLYTNAGLSNFEVIVAENNSTDPKTEIYYEQMLKKYENCKLVRYQGAFNFSAINNLARKSATGEYLLLLNNDIEIISEGFLREMLTYAQRDDVGAVGAKLYYPDDTIQHGGVILGINGSAGHSHKSHPRDAVGDIYRLVTPQNYMAVTGACLMLKAKLYDEAGGLCEGDFAVAYNDIDLCLKLYEKGYLNVFTPYAQAYHYESKSRGLDTNSENAKRYEREKTAFQNAWGKYLPEGADPYYNVHFNNLFENFGLK